MRHTRTVIEYRPAVAAVVRPIVSRDRIAGEASDRRADLAAERAVDEVLADSFPASDPPSWNPGISRPHPAEAIVTVAPPHQPGHQRSRIVGIDVSRPAVNEPRPLHAVMSVFGAAGLALLFVVAILSSN